VKHRVSAFNLKRSQKECILTHSNASNECALNALSALPSCKRKPGLFGPVVARNARGVKSSVHYIAFCLLHGKLSYNNLQTSNLSRDVLLEGFCYHWGLGLGCIMRDWVRCWGHKPIIHTQSLILSSWVCMIGY